MAQEQKHCNVTASSLVLASHEHLERTREPADATLVYFAQKKAQLEDHTLGDAERQSLKHMIDGSTHSCCSLNQLCNKRSIPLT